MAYAIHILILIIIFSMVACSLNLLAGYSGILSLAHAAFFGVGAYTAALMTVHLNAPFFFVYLAGGLVACVLGALIGLPTIRIKGDFFVVATFAFQTVVFNIFNNIVDITGGPMGINNIYSPVIIGWEIDTVYDFIVLAICLFLINQFFLAAIVRSPYGRVLRTIRDDEIFAVSMGKPVGRRKVEVFAIGAGFAGLAGALFAHYMSFIDPSSFSTMESIFFISIVIIGGQGSMWGPVLGAAVLVILPEDVLVRDLHYVFF